MPISQLFIDPEVAETPEAKSFRARLPASAVISDARAVFEAVTASEDPVQRGKQILFLTRNRGAFLRKCPGTRQYNCCGYQILHIGSFCTMDCAYCILQAYFHPPVLQFFLNQREMLTELDARLAEPGIHRIGTGEFTDSLIWEPWTDLNTLLVQKFSDQDRAVLELKTKTTAVERFKKLRHNRKTILAWSMNTPRVIAGEERGTASLTARLRAAAECVSWGYPVAFHFDPVIRYDGCEEEYHRVIREIFRRIPPENVAWISVGSFRFPPALKPVLQRRFPGSKIVYGEFIPGLDGKMRYFKQLRIDLYRKIVSGIHEIAPDVLVYFCMEDDAVWERVFGFAPADRGGLSKMLDKSAAGCCGLDAGAL